jgi:MFS family permease
MRDIADIGQSLSHKNMIFLSLGRVISDLGSAVFSFALSLYVLDLTGSAEAFSLILVAATAPRVFINLFAGVLADRYSRKRIMIYSDLLSGAAVLGFMMVFNRHPENLPLFVVYALVMSIINSFFNIAVYASIPDIVEKNYIEKANSILTAAGEVISIIGPVLGAVAYKAIPFSAIFLADGLSFMTAAIVTIFIVFRRVKTSDTQAAGGYLGELKLGFSYLKNNPIIMHFLGFATAVQMIFMPLVVLVLPYMAYNVLKLSGFQLSLMEGSWAIGAIAAAFAISSSRSSTALMRKFFLLVQLQALLFILWAFPIIKSLSAASAWAIMGIYCALLIFKGLLNSLQNILIFSHFQKIIPEDLRGRVFSVVSTALMVSTPLGMWVYGKVLGQFNVMWVVSISGAVLFIVSLGAGQLPEFRKFFDNLVERP